MTWVTDVARLEQLFGSPGAASLTKVAAAMTPQYRAWILASPFCVLATVGPEGTDASPRGDDGPVVQELDPHTLLMPDWRGNNRIDSLRNIVRDGRVSVMFMVPGSGNVVRVNGTARLSVDPGLLGRFEVKGRLPNLVIVIRISEIYVQCARAILRSRIWGDQANPEGLPSVGEILAEQTRGAIDAGRYDADWAPRAAQTLWSQD